MSGSNGLSKVTKPISELPTYLTWASLVGLDGVNTYLGATAGEYFYPPPSLKSLGFFIIPPSTFLSMRWRPLVHRLRAEMLYERLQALCSTTSEHKCIWNCAVFFVGSLELAAGRLETNPKYGAHRRLGSRRR